MVAEALRQDMCTHLQVATDEGTAHEFSFDLLLTLLFDGFIQPGNFGLGRVSAIKQGVEEVGEPCTIQWFRLSGQRDPKILFDV